MRFRVLLFIFLGYFPEAFSQSEETDALIERIIESVAEKFTEDFDFGELADRLHHYRRYPININNAGQEELSELVFLSPVQIRELLNHRQLNGDFLDVLELQSLETFDLATIKQLLPFITISRENTLTGIRFKDLRLGKHDLIFRYGQVLQQQKGYTLPEDPESTRYLGSPSKVLVRYRYNLNKSLLISLNMEKDAGEQFFAGRQPAGFDFYSGSVFFKNLGRVEKLALGDYSLQFGQGLALWSGLSFSHGVEVAGSAKQDIGLKPYTSLNEASYFRGVAATVKISQIHITPFLSYRSVDANLSDRDEITSLGVSGYHRTTTELGHKNAVSQFAAGAIVQYKSKQVNVGLTGYNVSFTRPFEAGKLLYNRFEFAGVSLSNLGLNYSYNLKNTYLFGEAAHSINSGLALLNGAITSLSPKLSAVILHRHYGKSYHSFFNQALSEASTAVNERGIYSGLVLKPSTSWELATYVDVFRFPWLKFGIDAPSQGFEIFSQATYTPGKRIKVSGRFRIEKKEQNDDAEATATRLQSVQKQNYRLELNYKISDALSVRSRAEVSAFKKGTDATELGQVLFQDVIVNPLSSRISGNVRFAVFDTHSFDSRIYAYENDVLYSYGMMAYQKRGFRFYTNARYTLKRGVDLWLRYAMISYPHEEEIGSGLEQINGNKKSDIKIQIRYQF